GKTWQRQVLPDSEDALLLSYLQKHPFFSFKEIILPLIRARWLLAACRNAQTLSQEQLEYLRRESINFLIRQIDEVCRDAGFNSAELGAIAPGISSGLIPLTSFPQSVAESVTRVSPTPALSLDPVSQLEASVDLDNFAEETDSLNLAGFDPAMLGPTFS
ncbi:MAG: hypothetical protein F6K32_24980, partial [Desertifilum sp. SIO1I2]|nr:hypothetical protein [Desertifilum sp. SIO1I2]